jgi:50S ribosomal subunit-associated GTPase HflX
MPRKALKESLQELREEVDLALKEPATDGLQEVRRKLDSILEEVDASEAASLEDGIHAVKDTIAELETSHPRITSALNQVMHLLSSVGI